MRTCPELVEYIRVLAKERGSSLTKLEETFSWANGTIGKWSKCKRYPSHEKLQLIADHFSVPLSDLTGETDAKEKPPVDDPELAELLDLWNTLAPSKRSALLQMARALK